MSRRYEPKELCEAEAKAIEDEMALTWEAKEIS